MLNELTEVDFPRVRALFKPLDYNLVLESILSGKTPARIYVDRVREPTVAFTGFKNRIFLAGSPGQEGINQALHQLIEHRIIPDAQAAGQDAFLLHVDRDAWETGLEAALQGRYPLRGQRKYYICTELHQDWRVLLPPGFTLHQVTEDLLAQSHLENVDDLREELCSERLSVEDFLEKSFGFCVLQGDAIAGWCLSEYNQDGRCEIGVATVQKYQRRSLGTVTTLALVEHALSTGYREVGWHCWKSNLPSAALALKAGFVHRRDYPVFLCVFDPAVQLSLHGNQCRQDGNYAEALVWYERAFTLPDAPAWAYFNAARCLALLGRCEAALDRLCQAFEFGFEDADLARSIPEFEQLHHHPTWQTLFG